MCGEVLPRGVDCPCDDGPIGSDPRRERHAETLLDRMMSNVEPGFKDRVALRQWLDIWLDEPLPALGGARPADRLETQEGRELIASLLGRVASGTHS